MSLMTSLSKFQEEAAFNISIYLSISVFLWSFSRCFIMMVSSIGFISWLP